MISKPMFVIRGFKEAGDHLTGQDERVYALLSIRNQEDAAWPKGSGGVFGPKLRLEFKDTCYRPHPDRPTEAHISAMLKWWREEVCSIEFMRSSMPVLIHCQQGKSRSVACALILLADVLGPGREQEALDD